MPLVREGDPTRTLIDASRPVHARTRVRLMARNVVLAIAWLTVAMYGLFLGDRRARGARVTVAAAGAAAILERYEAVIGIEVHCQLAHGVQDVLLAARRRTRTRRPTPTSAPCASACRGRCR